MVHIASVQLISNLPKGDLRLKKAIFREAETNPTGKVALLTKKVFTQFVLPIGLRNGDWTPGEDISKMWIKNLIADIQTSRIIRHVMREENARANEDPNKKTKFFFRDNHD